MDDESDEEDFNIIQPTLIQQLKNILEQYPDNGQILKEIIQNAEDAGAKVVRFLYDENDASTIFGQGIKELQGPSLYAYNDAYFNNEDWRGIRMFGQSLKEKDPLKVGRFGLGFKSTFHITDNPTIMSNSVLGIINPDERLFSSQDERKTGKVIDFQKKKEELRSSQSLHEDNSVVYSDLLGLDIGSGVCRGSVFRFHLRNQPSKLSKTIYDKSKIMELFESFKGEGHLSLVFMKNLEKIEFFVRRKGEVNAHLVSSFAIDGEGKSLALEKKKKFVMDLKNIREENRDEWIVFQTTVSVTQKQDEVLELKKRFRYAIIYHYAGKTLHDDRRMMSIASDKGYIPLVGIAFPYEKDLPTGGHVFCTLPLPVLGNASTSLPVHVNGFFALGPDRKDLKWGSAQGTQSSDQQVIWNQFLIEKVLPAAYEHLFTSMTSLPMPATASEVYDMLPDLSIVDAKWKKLAEALFRRIFHLPCLWTDACQGKWILPADALFKPNDGQPNAGLDIAVECLLKIGFSVVNVPKHIELAFCQLYDNTNNLARRYIEPMLVREKLKRRPDVINFEYKDRMVLLGYLISSAEDLDSLVGVPVLPLENGSFAVLKCRSAEPIYVPTDKHPKSLLPGLEHKLLKTDIDARLREIFTTAARNGRFQLAMLSENIVAESIKEVYSEKGSLLSLKSPLHRYKVAEWLHQLWRYARSFNLISRLEGLPLIPLEDFSEEVYAIRCGKVSKFSLILYLSPGAEEQSWADFMRYLGFDVVTALPLDILNYKDIFGEHIFKLKATHILSLFKNMSSLRGFDRLLAVFKFWKDVSVKMKLKELLLDIRHWDIDARKDRVRKLPLFKNSLDDGLTSVDEVNQIVPNNMPAAPPRRKLLCCNDETSERLAFSLGAVRLTKERLIEDVIIPEIRQQLHNNDTIDEFMQYILPDVAASLTSRFSQSTTTINFQLRSISFVRAADSRRYRPNELFDSTDPNLLILLGPDYPKFPTGMYTKEPFIHALKKLGLKTTDKIASEDIQHIAMNISVCKNFEEKALHLVKHIENHPGILSRDTRELLQNTSWVPVMQKRPNDYPGSLTWLAEKNMGAELDKPTNMALEDDAKIVGAVKRIVPKVYSTTNMIRTVFQPVPSLFDVLKQLQHVTRDYRERNRSQYALVVTKIYAFLSSRDLAAIKKSMEEMGQFEWVWNGEGFTSAEKILVDDFSLDLKPFIWRLPKEMKNFEKLFLDLGSSRVCSEEMLIRVLEEMQGNYDDNTLETSEAAAESDLKLSAEILSQLKNEPLSTQLRERLVVPIHTQQCLKFDLADNTVYAPEQASITYDYEATNDGETTDDSGVDGEIKYLHPIIPEDVATTLGIRSLTSKMLGAEDLGLFEEYGQTEPLTRRINRILQDYGDGSAIIKELVQNADDAGAAAVKFLYDERQNRNLRTSLIDKAMQGFQGPALWAYNSAVFTKQDFDNITKLSGATKEYQRDKIGRFGLGFNAVYNLTDVPSFVSEDHLVIFDPHTTNLGRAISNKSKPGVKINVGTNRGRLKHFKDQLAPYNGIFGMDMNLDATHQSFPGTLFRFPLRTRQQAASSEIKNLCYDKVEMKKLLSKFAEEADKILVFTENVRKIQVFRLEENAVSPSEMKELISVTKNVAQEIRPLVVNGRQHGATQVMRASAQAVEKAGRNPGDYVPIRCSSVHSIQVVLSRDGRDYFQNNMLRDANDKWLIHSMSGSINSKCLKMALRNRELNPLASIAISVGDADSRSCQLSFSPLDSGHYFCFLPLPIANGLPVHVNSTFAVTADRKSIKQVNEDDKNNTTTETQWNSAIMADPVATAYLAALEDLTSLTRLDTESEWFELWPTRAYEYSSYHDCLLESFYGNMIRNQLRLLPAVSARTWVAWRDIVIVDYNLDADIKTHMESVITHFSNNRTVIDLPLKVITTINDCGLKVQLQSVIIKFEVFFTAFFFINKLQHADMPVSARNSIVLFLIENLQKYPNLKSVFMQTRCIPTLPRGTLKSPVELVKPKSKASNLYAEADEVFPYGEEFNRSSCLETLETLGMIADNPKWEVLESRAGTISSMEDHKSATTRSRYLIQLIDEKLPQEKPNHETLLRWRDLEFLPAKSAPPSWSHLPWAGGSSKRFCNVGEIYPSCLENLLCCHSPVINEGDRGCGRVSQRVFDFFKIPTKANLDQVFMQIDEIANMEVTKPVKEMLHGIYEYLNEVCIESEKGGKKRVKNGDKNAETVRSKLINRPILPFGKRLIKASVFAFQQDYPAEPYLLKVSENLTRRYKSFLSTIGVKETFDLADYMHALERIEVESHNIPLKKEQINLVRNLLESVNSLRNGEEVKVFLPDHEAVLQPMEQIHVKDAHWLRDEPSLKYIHPKIPDSLALSLGAKTVRAHSIDKQSRGIPFGQHEKLTVRLKKILDGYSGEMQILHEILQNADDAGATKLAIILDGRMHPSTRVFSDAWKPLQGPAILFSNNAPFTESDLQGIQDLGEGSKSNDPLKTGQYGVGFNVVYHVTDAPSLLTHVKDRGSCLCIFDPHAKFLDECSQSEPGRMFSDARNFLEKDFPDIYASFIPDMLTDPKSTIFRLPLRNPEMARESKIKGEPISVDDLHKMLLKFKSEAAESLLFLKNVEAIEISEIEADGKIQNICSISSEYLEAGRCEKLKLNEEFKTIANSIKNKNREYCSDDFATHHYKLKLHGPKVHDSRVQKAPRNPQTWEVIQKNASVNSNALPTSVSEQYDKELLRIFPSGGVAINLDGIKTSKNVFCLLPLQVSSSLPLNINGNFVLDYETRRKLWFSDESCFQKDWNNYVIQNCIIPCYIALLKKFSKDLTVKVGYKNVEEVIKETFAKSADKQLHFSVSRLIPSQPTMQEHHPPEIEKYFKYFPTLDYRYQSFDYSKYLVKMFYKKLSESETRLLPVLRAESWTQKISVDLCPSNSSGKQFYIPDNNLSKSSNRFNAEQIQSICSLLLKMGMNIYNLPQPIVASFRDSGVPLQSLSPRVVIEYLRKDATAILDTPRKVSDTIFKDEATVTAVLMYCLLQEEIRMADLEGLPLLLTEDNYLRIISSSTKIYFKDLSGLFPNRKHMCLHPDLRNHLERLMQRDKGWLRRLRVAELNQIFNEEFDAKLKSCDEIEHTPRLFRLWKFLRLEHKHECEEHSKKENLKRERAKEEKRQYSKTPAPAFKDFLQEISQWCLVPVKRKLNGDERKTLMRIGLIQRVVCVCQVSDIADALALPQLDKDSIDFPTNLSYQGISSSTYLSNTDHENSAYMQVLLASESDSESFLKALYAEYKRENSGFQRIECELAKKILDFFNGKLYYYNEKNEDLSLLKSLPVFEDICGHLHTLEGRRDVFRVPDEMPTAGISSIKRVIFLKENRDVRKLFELLQLKEMSLPLVYKDHIFPYFVEFTNDQQLKHLEFLREKIKNHHDESTEQLLEQLRELAFIKTRNGSLEPASSFYDAEVDIFRIMLKDNAFPPAPFCEQKWLEFLRKCGLITSLSSDLFLRLAKAISKIQITSEENKQEILKKSSQALVDYLLESDSLRKETVFLEKLSSIEFLLADSLPEKLREILPVPKRRKICFQGALENSPKTLKLAWTAENVLPSYASSRWLFGFGFTRGSLASIESLKVQKNLSAISVARNLVNVCTQSKLLKRISNGVQQLTEEKMRAVLEEVFHESYDYLSKKQPFDTTEVDSLLKGNTVIIVNGGQLVIPEKTTLEEKSEIPPYLFSVPVRFGKYFDFFTSLGTTKTANSGQFVGVLREINACTNGKALSPNEAEAAFKALQRLSRCIGAENNESWDSYLYLPGIESACNETMKLFSIKHLVYFDDKHFEERLKKLNRPRIAVNKEFEENDLKTLVGKLPVDLKPIFVSEIISEELLDSEKVQNLDFAEDLQNRIQSQEFANGLLRLLMQKVQEKESEEELRDNLTKLITSTNVLTLAKIETVLYDNGVIVDDSKQTKDVFVIKKDNALNLHISQEKVVKAQHQMFSTISRGFAEHFHEYLTDPRLTPLLNSLLQCHLQDIESFLDAENIRRSDNVLSINRIYQIGDFVPIELHCLLVNEIVQLGIGEYVAYEAEDPMEENGEGEATYIYAKVAGKGDLNDDAKNYYKIEYFPGKFKLVHYSEIYRFERQDEFSDAVLPYTGTSADETQRATKEPELAELLDEITKTIKDAFKEDNEFFKKIVKRLYLRWHPDKNPGREEFCKNVFQHIQAEIAKLESIPEMFFTNFYNRGSRFSSNRRKFRNGGSSYSWSGGNSSSQGYWGAGPTTRNPQPGEARRWYRQAKCDYDAASTGLDGEFYEWVCFKCHQGAEKGLKAAVFTIDSKRTNGHNLGLIAEDIDNANLKSLASQLERLLGSSTHLRYPNMWPYPTIPHTAYDQDTAEKALALTGKLMEEIKTMVN